MYIYDPSSLLIPDFSNTETCNTRCSTSREHTGKGRVQNLHGALNKAGYCTSHSSLKKPSKHKLPGLMACVRVDWAEGTQPLCLVFYANSKGKSLTSKVSNQILSKLCCSQWPNTITNSTDCVMFRASSQDNFRGLCGLMQTKLHAWQTNAQGVFFLNKATCRTLLET